MANAIGTFTFDFLSRLDGRGHGPEMGGTATSVTTRPGVNGVNIRREGRKGQPFQMESRVLISSAPAMRLLLDEYKQSEGLIATLEWEGIRYDVEYGNVYGILHVGQFQVFKVGAAVVGTVNHTGSFYLRAVWDLIPVAASQV